MRRLPVYILIDTSGSMKGEPIEAVKAGLNTMLSSLRADPYALETVWVSVITFDSTVKVVLPLTPVDEAQMPDIEVPESGATLTGLALSRLAECMDADARPAEEGARADWRPVVFLLTDGKPSDTMEFNLQAEAFRRRKLGGLIACAAGEKAKIDPLFRLTPQVYRLHSLDAAGFRQFFAWVSRSIEMDAAGGSASASMELPEPPDEVFIVC